VLDDNLVIALLDLYAKYGSIDNEYELFHGLMKKNLVVYFAMIFECGIHGKTPTAVRFFEYMLRDGNWSNLPTYTGILILSIIMFDWLMDKTGALPPRKTDVYVSSNCKIMV